MKRILHDHLGLAAMLAVWVALGFALVAIFGEPSGTWRECEPNGVFGGTLDC